MNAETTPTVPPTILTHEYSAPIDLVFDAWTNPEHIKSWQRPTSDFACEFAHADIRPGGYSLHKMTAPNGFEMWLKTEYRSITPHTELSFVQFTSNPDGEFLPNPQMPDWPRDLLTTIKLEAVGGMTKLTLEWQPLSPTASEIEAFEATRKNHGDGWGSGLNQLTSYLEKLVR